MTLGFKMVAAELRTTLSWHCRCLELRGNYTQCSMNALAKATVNCGVETTNVMRLLIKGYGARASKRAVGAISYAEGYVESDY